LGKMEAKKVNKVVSVARDFMVRSGKGKGIRREK